MGSFYRKGKVNVTGPRTVLYPYQDTTVQSTGTKYQVLVCISTGSLSAFSQRWLFWRLLQSYHLYSSFLN